MRDVACRVITGGPHAARKANRALPQIGKVLAEAAGKRRGRRPAGEPPRANRAGTGPRANTTGPDVRVMRNQKGYVAGCNGQAVVTAGQVTAGAMLSRHPAGRTPLHPLPGTCREQLTQAGIRPRLRTVLAGSGYVSEETFARADQDKLRLLAPLAKDPGRVAAPRPEEPGTPASPRPPPAPRGACGIPAAGRTTSCGPRTAEPVSGQLKTCQEQTMMSRRGLTARESEWLLACAAHNLAYIFRLERAGRRFEPRTGSLNCRGESTKCAGACNRSGTYRASRSLQRPRHLNGPATASDNTRNPRTRRSYAGSSSTTGMVRWPARCWYTW